jgi:hypothetical protein
MEETAAYIQAHVLKMQPLLKEAQTIPFPPADIDPTDEKVHQICHNYGKKFIDKDFPPTITSLFKADTKLTPGEMSGMAVSKRSAIEWKRASDFMEGEYHVFEGGRLDGHPQDRERAAVARPAVLRQRELHHVRLHARGGHLHRDRQPPW